jgi:hypothetical protein
VFNQSDPGTGKCRVCIETIRYDPLGSRTLVLAPRSILEPAWAQDLRKFAPDIPYAIATPPNRASAFRGDARVILTNHDAAPWLLKHSGLWSDFHRLIIDESTAFKHREAQRSQAMAQVARLIPNRMLLSGTPTPEGILDLWHQLFLLDQGERLGRQFYRFRDQTCMPVTERGTTVWVEKPGAAEAIGERLQDLTLRFRLADCLELPEHHQYTVAFELAPAHRHCYEQAARDAVLALKVGPATRLKSQALAHQLLQIASGAVYTGGGNYTRLATERYELILDLVEARAQSVVAFLWRHQREELVALAQRRQIPFAVIDGSIKPEDRSRAVNDFQAGCCRVLFVQPQSAGHGLTLTRGTATIWASPTYRLELFEQLNRRIYRAGQTQRTETILVCATNTIESRIYAALAHKGERLHQLLDLLES